MPISSLPNWLQERKSEAQAQIQAVGWPSSKDEPWLYTSIEKYNDKRYAKVAPHDPQLNAPAEILDLIKSADAVVAFYNGQFLPNVSKEISQTDLNIVRLSRILLSSGRLSELAKSFIARQPAIPLRAYGYEQVSQFGDGAFVYINSPEHKKNILLLHMYGNRHDLDVQQPFAVYPRNLVAFGAGVQGSVVEAHIALNEIPFYINNCTQVLAEAESQVDVAQVWWLGEEAHFITDNTADVQSQARLNWAQVLHGSAMGRSENLLRLNQSGAQLNWDSVVYGSNKTHTDLSTSILHISGDTKSEQVARGVYADQSSGVFSGHLKIYEDAQKSDARQLSKNLLLGEEAKAYTKPQLEVFADDVKAAHGATVGALDENEIFYLMSRGITQSEAIQMLSAGLQREALRHQGVWVRGLVHKLLSRGLNLDMESRQ